MPWRRQFQLERPARALSFKKFPEVRKNGVAGDTPADEKLGRYIADALAVVPRIRPEVFDKIFNGHLQDLLMVSYLSNLTKTQLDIATKLHGALK